jgi:hypothetical protein
MIDSLRRLHPVHHNVPMVWEEFEQVFKDKFVDSTHKLRARNQLKQLKFKCPNIDKYIANFEDLIVHAGYNLASKEVINLFLKRFSKNRTYLTKSLPYQYQPHIGYEEVTHHHSQINATGQLNCTECT